MEWYPKHIGHAVKAVLFQLLRPPRVEAFEDTEDIDPQQVVSEAKEHQDDFRPRCIGFLGPRRCASLNLSSTILHRLNDDCLPMLDASGISSDE